MKILFFILTVLLISFNSEAYELYKNKNGENITWKQSVIELILDDSMLKLGKKKDIEFIIKGALDLWVIDSNLPLSFVIVWDEWDECDGVLNDQNNCIITCYDDGNFKCNRPVDKASTTYITIRSPNDIIDVDIVVNAEDWDWSLDCKNEDGLCFQRVMVHEFGHMIGINHSEYQDAVMYKFMNRKYDKVDEFHWDDIEASETLYDDFIVEYDDFYELACSTSIIGNYNESNSIFDLFRLIL